MTDVRISSAGFRVVVLFLSAILSFGVWSAQRFITHVDELTEMTRNIQTDMEVVKDKVRSLREDLQEAKNSRIRLTHKD